MEYFWGEFLSKLVLFLVINFHDFPRLFSKHHFQEFLGLGNTK